MIFLASIKFEATPPIAGEGFPSGFLLFDFGLADYLLLGRSLDSLYKVSFAIRAAFVALTGSTPYLWNIWEALIISESAIFSEL
jgi:hypothetical protein